jgi:hypothetical protein
VQANVRECPKDVQQARCASDFELRSRVANAFTTAALGVLAVLPAIMRTTTISAVAAWALLSAACNPHYEAAMHRRAALEEQQDLAMLRERACFELQCKDTQLRVLDRYDGGPATLVGAHGCGRQAMYQRRLRYSYQQGGRTTRNTKWERATTAMSAPPVPPPPDTYVAPPPNAESGNPVSVAVPDEAGAPQQAPALSTAPPPAASTAPPAPTRVFGSAPGASSP